jgi:transcriptional regulator with XRE-family HTH domain
VEVGLLIKQKLAEQKLEQRDLAAAAQVTESYISQLLSLKKLPPAPSRTDIYEKIEKFLKLRQGKLAELAEHQRNEGLKKSLVAEPVPLLKDVRELILGKCAPGKERQVRAIFETHPFGEMERLVTQKLLDVMKKVAKDELDNEAWLRSVAHLAGRSYEALRVSILEFLDTDVFSVSAEHCGSFLNPLIESWDIDLATFGLGIVLNRRLIAGHARRVEFVEKEVERKDEEPGLKKFLKFEGVRGDITEDEIEFLRKLKFKGKQPTALYYYRELQSLRDPLHFRTPTVRNGSKKQGGQSQPLGSVAPLHQFSDARRIEKQVQLDSRKGAIHRWNGDRGSRN